VTTASDEQGERGDNERRRQEVEAGQDHPAEEERCERDGREREPSLGRRAPETAQADAEEDDPNRAGGGHLGGEDDAVRGERLGHERRREESG